MAESSLMDASRAGCPPSAFLQGLYVTYRARVPQVVAAHISIDLAQIVAEYTMMTLREHFVAVFNGFAYKDSGVWLRMRCDILDADEICIGAPRCSDHCDSFTFINNGFWGWIDPKLLSGELTGLLHCRRPRHLALSEHTQICGRIAQKMITTCRAMFGAEPTPATEVARH